MRAVAIPRYSRFDHSVEINRSALGSVMASKNVLFYQACSTLQRVGPAIISPVCYSFCVIHLDTAS